jgi:hypothetical protein
LFCLANLRFVIAVGKIVRFSVWPNIACAATSDQTDCREYGGVNNSSHVSNAFVLRIRYRM